MSRPKGSKNKKVEDVVVPEVAIGAITQEDMELERKLASLDAFDMPPDIEPEPPGMVLKKDKEKAELLSDSVESYAPAKTDQELREQVYQAKLEGCDSIEATKALAQRFCRDPKLMDVGYFIFQDVKVYVEGFFDQVKKRDSVTIEQRLFPNQIK